MNLVHSHLSSVPPMVVEGPGQHGEVRLVELGSVDSLGFQGCTQVKAPSQGYQQHPVQTRAGHQAQ